MNRNSMSLFLVYSDQIAVRQSQVDKLYAGLKDLAQERRSKLEEVLKLYMLSHEIEDLMQWIAEKEVVACLNELGQDFEHVTVSIQFLCVEEYCKILFSQGFYFWFNLRDRNLAKIFVMKTSEHLWNEFVKI